MFKLDNDGIETIRIYEFDSEEKQKFTFQEHQKRQVLVSSHSPIVFQKGHVLVLYHYDYRDSPTQPLVLSDTKFGEKLEKAIEGLK